MAKRKRVPKGGAVWHLSAEEATLVGKPRYNGYACGHGAHGDAKYNRTKENRAWRAQLNQEGASRGPFLMPGSLASACRRAPAESGRVRNSGRARGTMALEKGERHG